MPVVLPAMAGNPLPGEVASGEIGGLRVAIHDGFPGVLIGLSVLSRAAASIRRVDLATGESRLVRTGTDLILEGGQAAAYDIEAEPGRQYLYRTVVDGVERPVYDVRVTMPAWSQSLPSQRTGWLKSVDAPHLSRAVAMGPPPDQTIGMHTSVAAPWGARHGLAATAGRAALSGQYVVYGLPDDDQAAILALLTQGGPLLWQPRPQLRTEGRWLTVTGIRDRHITGPTPAREWTIDWVEQDRPEDGLDAPVTVPGWTWERYTAGHTWDSLGRIYRDTWALLFEGVKTPWSQDAGRTY